MLISLFKYWKNKDDLIIIYFSLGFEELQKAYQKATPVIQKEENGQTPRFFIRCLVEMEDFINEMWEDREGRKNMSKNNR